MGFPRESSNLSGVVFILFPFTPAGTYVCSVILCYLLGYICAAACSFLGLHVATLLNLVLFWACLCICLGSSTDLIGLLVFSFNALLFV
uniref:Uncharacterized protein n=1 Tax=Setaria viridis TaxID=4556 RepID=A0A4U6W2J8_SETVI|nr:hypothetical protein SEVIR_2G119750v2 [Setaria viridis]